MNFDRHWHERCADFVDPGNPRGHVWPPTTGEPPGAARWERHDVTGTFNSNEETCTALAMGAWFEVSSEVPL